MGLQKSYICGIINVQLDLLKNITYANNSISKGRIEKNASANVVLLYLQKKNENLYNYMYIGL